MLCATTVRDFLGALCATIGVSWSTKCYDHIEKKFVSLLSSTCIDVLLRPLVFYVTTTFISQDVL